MQTLLVQNKIAFRYSIEDEWKIKLVDYEVKDKMRLEDA